MLDTLILIVTLISSIILLFITLEVSKGVKEIKLPTQFIYKCYKCQEEGHDPYYIIPICRNKHNNEEMVGINFNAHGIISLLSPLHMRITQLEKIKK